MNKIADDVNKNWTTRTTKDYMVKSEQITEKTKEKDKLIRIRTNKDKIGQYGQRWTIWTTLDNMDMIDIFLWTK